MDYRQALSPGFVLTGQYRIERVLGVGGFGITYAAMDIGLDLQVAVKEYFPADFGRREQTLEVRPRSNDQTRVFEQCRASFLREARTLAQFRNPSIVRVLRVFEAHGTAYMVMEFERGLSLAGWAEALGRPPTQAELDRILKPLVAALQDIHAAGVIHRDIAPDNVLIRDDGSPVLIDFGAARQVLVEASRNFTGIVKQGFSPPEQYAMDAKLQGPWTDIYALGGILYQLVTGEKPVPAPERQLGIVMHPASEMARGPFRPSFLAGIDRALAIAPSERPQSLAQLSQLVMPEADEPRRTVDLDPISEPLPLQRSRPEPAPRPQRREAPRQPEYPLPPTKRLSPDLSRQMRVVVPVLAAAAVVGAMVWFAGGVATEKPTALPASVVLDQREQAERQRLEAEKKAAAERTAAEERRKATEKAEAERQRIEAERQRAEAEKKAAAERAAAEERRKAAEKAEAERQRAEAEQKAAAERAVAEERRKAAEKAEADRQRAEAEKKAAAERAAAEERRKAAEKAEAERQRLEAERQRAEAEKKAATDRAAAEERRKAAEKAEADRQRAQVERQRAEAEKKAAAERAAAEERRKAAEKAEADRQRAEAERQRVEAENKAAAERAAAEDRRRAAEQAETERQRQDAERQRLAAEQQAAEAQRVLIVDIRQELNRVGCTTRATTPNWADDDQRALERFVDNSGGTISFPELNRDIVQTLQRFRQRVCQPQCATGETLVDGRCERPLQPGTPSAAVQCRQINERAQLGILTDEDRAALRRLNCR